MQEPRSACSLDRTSQEKRLHEIAELASKALLEVTPAEGGAHLRLRGTNAVQSELRRLIDAEAKCCPFLRFEMRATDEEVLLDVSGPDDAQPLIDRLFMLRLAGGAR